MGLYRLAGNGPWQSEGLFVGGPGYEPYFALAPLEGGGIDDIGFGRRHTKR